jgi:hypothetical protein
MRTPYLKLAFCGCSLELCHLSFFSDPLSSLLTSVVANEQGGDGGEPVDGTHRISDRMINDQLFGGGGYENECCRIDARCACSYLKILGII